MMYYKKRAAYPECPLLNVKRYFPNKLFGLPPCYIVVAASVLFLDKLSGPKWVIIMIDSTWRSVHTLWDLRNGHVYGKDASTRAQKQKEQAHRELRALYILRRDMRHCDRDIFYPNVDEHLDAQPVWASKNWLQVYKPMVKHSIKEETLGPLRPILFPKHIRTSIPTEKI
jgi:hypothetical protein